MEAINHPCVKHSFNTLLLTINASFYSSVYKSEISIFCVQHNDVVQGLTNGAGPAAPPWNKPRHEN